MNSKVKVVGKRLYSTNFIYLAVLESVQSHSQVFIFSPQSYRQMYGKKRLDASSIAKSLKFNKDDPLPGTFTLLFKNCSEFIFVRKSSAVRFPYKHSKFGTDRSI